MKYNLNSKAKILEKIFNAGFTDEKSILTIQLDDLQKISDISSNDILMIINLKKAIRNKKIIAFFYDYDDKKEKNERNDMNE